MAGLIHPRPPGPRPQPFVGHALRLSRNGLPYLRWCATEFGDAVELRLLRKRALFVNRSDYIGQILTASPDRVGKGLTRHVDHDFLGEGVSLLEGADWLGERRVLQPAFHRSRLDRYADIVTRCTERLLATWRDGESRDLYADMTRLALDVVASSLFGFDFDLDATLGETLAAALAHRAAGLRSAQVFLPAALPSPVRLKLRWDRRRIDRRLQREIARRRAAPSDRGDLLTCLISDETLLGRATQDKRVKDEIVTMLVGGTETVADLLTWIWLLLARHPTIEARLVADLTSPVDGGTPRSSVGRPATYLNAVIAETLRLYPPASILARETLTEFDVGPFRVLPGTILVVSPWVTHRHPRYFESPDCFHPDRWLDESTRNLPPYAYIPFGGGPRLCLGKSFAVMEAVAVVSTIAQRYRFEIAPDQVVIDEPVPTLRPRDGLRTVIRERRSPESA